MKYSVKQKKYPLSVCLEVYILNYQVIHTFHWYISKYFLTLSKGALPSLPSLGSGVPLSVVRIVPIIHQWRHWGKRACIVHIHFFLQVFERRTQRRATPVGGASRPIFPRHVGQHLLVGRLVQWELTRRVWSHCLE